MKAVKNLLKRLAGYFASKSKYKFIIKNWIIPGDLDKLCHLLETKIITRNIEPILMDPPAVKKVIVIAPHQDDGIFSSGGALLKLAGRGCMIKVVYLTSETEETKKESIDILKKLGAEAVFFNYTKRNIPIDSESVARLRKVFQEMCPDVVFLPFITDDHDDHKRASQFFYETFKFNPSQKTEAWAYQVYSTVLTNVIVDITDEIDLKAELINMWNSRKRSRDWVHYIKGLNAFNSRFLRSKKARYAECFFVVPVAEYIDICRIYFEKPNSEICSSESCKKR